MGAVVGDYIVTFPSFSFWDTGTPPPIYGGHYVIVHRPTKTARVFTGHNYRAQFWGAVVLDGLVFTIRNRQSLVGTPRVQAIDPVTGGIWTYTAAGVGRNALAVGDYVLFNNGFSGTTWTTFNPATDTNASIDMTPFTLNAWASHGGHLFVVDSVRGVRKYTPTGTLVDEWLFPPPSPYWGYVTGTTGHVIGGAIYWPAFSPNAWFRFDPSTGAQSRALASPSTGLPYDSVELGGLLYNRQDNTTMRVHDPNTGLWRDDTFPGSANFTDSSLPYGIGSWFCAADDKLWFPTSHPVVW